MVNGRLSVFVRVSVLNLIISVLYFFLIFINFQFEMTKIEKKSETLVLSLLIWFLFGGFKVRCL